MAETHDWGRFYWHVVRVPWKTPPVQLDGISHEVEEPWRIGHCVLLRLLFLPWCLVLGWWGPGRTEEEMREAEEALQVRRQATVEEIRKAGADVELTGNEFKLFGL